MRGTRPMRDAVTPTFSAFSRESLRAKAKAAESGWPSPPPSPASGRGSKKGPLPRPTKLAAGGGVGAPAGHAFGQDRREDDVGGAGVRGARAGAGRAAP